MKTSPRVVLWGGDFNQALSGREYVGTHAGRDALISAFRRLGLRAATADAEGSLDGMTAIDHLAVPGAWRAGVSVVRPSLEARPLSDHPLYIADLEIPVDARG